jgi:hypothetical protein
MLCDQELCEFFAHVEELSQASQDSTVTNHFQPTNHNHDKLQEENAKLRAKLLRASKSTREVIDVFKNERNLKNAALQELEETKTQMSEIQRQFDELQNENVNKQFSWREKFDDLDMRNQDTLNSYVELSKDYLNVLSEATISYCFEINRDRNKILNRTENFLKSRLEKFEMPKIISRRAVKATEKPIAKRTRKSKQKEQEKEKENTNRKRRKIENFDMQSISQVTSPASFYEDETVSEVGSSFTFNTFSIGNETSYSTIESRMEKISHKCKCQEEGAKLVSIGVDTEDLFQPPLPSVPLLNEDIDFDTNEIACSTFDSEIHENSVEIAQEPEEEPIEVPTKTSTSIGINTEILTSNKSTSTVHSTTTRGTSTPQVVSKNFAMQFPEINYEKIFSETIFELPDCLSPIDELEELIEEIEKESTVTTASTETQTNLLNVCREIDYVARTTINNGGEEQSFTLLGKSVFNIFLERLRKSNKSLDDEASARERLWSYMQQQFFDRFEELTFDDYCNPSFLLESDKSGTSKGMKDIKEKENYEEVVPEETKNVETKLSETKPTEEPENSREFDKILENIERQCLTLSPVLEPIPEIAEFPEMPEIDEKILEIHEEVKEKSLVDELFGETSDMNETNSSYERSPSPASIIDDLDISDTEESNSETENENDTDEELNSIDFDSPMSPSVEDRGFEGDFYIETPKSPPPFAKYENEDFEPFDIPLETSSQLALSLSENPLAYHTNIRQNLVQWQQRHAVNSKVSDKVLCKIRKAIKIYLDAEWNDENLKICLDELNKRNELLILEAIYETVEDNDWQRDINLEFTPPAPPLPRYQQKLIVLIKKLSESYKKLPQMLLEDLEMKLFRCENGKSELNYLRNIAYYYTSLIDLFFEENSSIAFFFIVKCIYFFSYKAIPMVFVVLKAFPQALPKKSALLKKHNTNIDWENMTGLELSKIRVDLEWVDSLDLTVIYLLTSIQMYRRKDDNAIHEHELFNYVPKFYGFPLNFLAAPKLLEILMKRFEDGEFKNLTLSLILLAKRMNFDFTMRTLIKGKLLPTLFKLIKEISDEMKEKKVDQICILIDVISSILKALTEEKDKSFKEIFPLIVNALGRADKIQKIQECCIRAILRLQRFIDNHKEIYDILEKHYERRHSFSESLRLSIVTFIHRKNEIYFKK